MTETTQLILGPHTPHEDFRASRQLFNQTEHDLEYAMALAGDFVPAELVHRLQREGEWVREDVMNLLTKFVYWVYPDKWYERLKSTGTYVPRPSS